MFGHMKDPVDGTATLVSYTEGGHGHASLPVNARVVLHAVGMDPQTVAVDVRMPKSELPLTVGQVWNVRFERSRPSHVKFSWGAVNGQLDHELLDEIDKELRVDEVRVLHFSRRRGSK